MWPRDRLRLTSMPMLVHTCNKRLRLKVKCMKQKPRTTMKKQHTPHTSTVYIYMYIYTYVYIYIYTHCLALVFRFQYSVSQALASFLSSITCDYHPCHDSITHLDLMICASVFRSSPVASSLDFMAQTVHALVSSILFVVLARKCVTWRVSECEFRLLHKHSLCIQLLIDKCAHAESSHTMCLATEPLTWSCPRTHRYPDTRASAVVLTLLCCVCATMILWNVCQEKHRYLDRQLSCILVEGISFVCPWSPDIGDAEREREREGGRER